MALSYETSFSLTPKDLVERLKSRVIKPFTDPFRNKKTEGENVKTAGEYIISILLVLAAPFIAIFGLVHSLIDALALATDKIYKKLAESRILGLSSTFYIVAAALVTVVTLFVLNNLGILALSTPALSVALASLVVLIGLNYLSKRSEELDGKPYMRDNAKATLALLTALAPVAALMLPANPAVLIVLSLLPLLLTSMGIIANAALKGYNVFEALKQPFTGVKKADPVNPAELKDKAKPVAAKEVEDSSDDDEVEDSSDDDEDAQTPKSQPDY